MKKPIRGVSAAAAFLLSVGCSSNDSLPTQTGSGGAAGAAGSTGAGGKAPPSGGAGATGGANGVGPTGTAGVQGTGGAAGAGGSAGAGGGGGGAGGGAGGAGNDGWVKIFNGVDLTGWYPLIHKSAYKADPYNTFRADPVAKVLKVTYEDYPGGTFDERCGLLYYDKFLTNYRVRVTYRFVEPQADNAVGWGRNNTGLMIFGIDPASVTGDPMFPPAIEIQLLGTPSSGGTNNANLCQPGGMRMNMLHGLATPDGNCHDSKSGPARAAAEWTTVEAEVNVAGDTKVFQYPDMTTPVLTISGPTYQNKAVTGGYLSLQSESQPLEYKDIELKELP